MAEVATQFTCFTCRVIFTCGDLQRNHYRCDWHRYNLKRRAAGLPPVSAEDFTARVAASQAAAEVTSDERPHCSDCKKTFSSVQTLENHLNSKAHLKVAKKTAALAESDASGDSVRRTNRGVPPRIRKPVTERIDLATQVWSAPADNEDDWEDVDDEGSDSLEEIDNSRQRDMAKGQNGTKTENAPDQEMRDASSPEELPMEPELADCIPPHVCLFCNKVSGDLEQNLEHMAVNHSFFIPDSEYLVNVEGLLIYLGYKVGALKICLLCDNDEKTPFRSILAVQQHMIDRGHTSMAFTSPLEYSDFYDYTSTHPEGADPDEEFDPEVLFENDDWTLQLPSGACIGHRSLMRYYRQRLPPRTAATTNRPQSLVFERYKALGWTNAITTMQARMKARDQKVAQRLLARKELSVKLKVPNMCHQKNKLIYR